MKMFFVEIRCLQLVRIFLLILILLIGIFVSVATEGFAVESAHTLARNLALKAPYRFEPLARYPHTQGAGDAFELTDGQYARRHFWTTRDATVGWLQSGTIRIELDLRSSYLIDAVTINSARGENARVSFPKRIDVFVSSDDFNYIYLGNMLQDEDRSDGPYLVKKFSMDVSATGRYIVFLIEPKGKYTFFDEIEVLGTDQNKLLEKVSHIQKKELSGFQKRLVQSDHCLTALDRELNILLKDTINEKSSVSQAVVDVREKIRRLQGTSDVVDKDNLESQVYSLRSQVLSQQFERKFLIWHQNPWMAFSSFSSPGSEQLLTKSLLIDLPRFGTASEAINFTNCGENTVHYIISVKNHEFGPTIALREAVPILLESSEMLADPLVQIPEKTISLVPGESKQIWMTVESRDAQAGVYSVNIDVIEGGDGDTHVVPILINISDVELSVDKSLMVNTWAYLNWRAIRHMPEKAVADLLSHHSNVAILHPSQVPWPVNFKNNTPVSPDYTKFDNFIRQYKGADRFLFYFGFNSEDKRNLGSFYPYMSEEWKDYFGKWIEDWCLHALKLGLSYEDFAFYPLDEPDNSTEANFLIDIARLIKAIDPRLQLYTTIDLGGRISQVNIEEIAKYVDTFQIGVSKATNTNAKYLKSLGKELWTYSSGNKSTDPIDFYRLQSWRAFRNEVTGIGFWAYADTGSSGVAWDDLDGNRPDHSVIYEGEDEIISSKRWEAWREGIEDYFLLKYAQNKIQSEEEEEEFYRRLDYVIQNPGDYINFQETRRFLLKLASRLTDE
jgi:hypothetical protein